MEQWEMCLGLAAAMMLWVSTIVLGLIQLVLVGKGTPIHLAGLRPRLWYWIIGGGSVLALSYLLGQDAISKELYRLIVVGYWLPSVLALFTLTSFKPKEAATRSGDPHP